VALLRTIPIVAAGTAAEHASTLHTAGTVQLSSLPPLSLYVHLPWCIKKCPYCDFNSHEARAGGFDEAAYVRALLTDLEAALPLIWGRSVHSIFFGGGTPSLFSPDALAELISGLRARLRLEPGCEITLEANPGTFERQRFAAFAQAGVTRLSVGVQSFNDAHLKALGRVHDAQQARAALDEAAKSFATFNLDLMYALPGQSLADLQADLRTALGFSPPHLSIYHLTIEPNTLFANQPPPHLPEDELAYDMLDAITEATAAAGLQRYEVSAFARNGHRCAHNLNYWQFGDYLGIGAGAHSKLSFARSVLRQVRKRDPYRYLADAAAGASLVTQEQTVSADELPFEYMLNALRLLDGVPLADFVERTGQPLGSILPALEQAERLGLLEQSPGQIRPTTRGMDMLSDLTALFLPKN
jgi:putative oxygen-independent coproporphyrinogen III oxidase